MTRCLVTGCAGFIGSSLTEALLAQGGEVVGVDCFTPHYERLSKESNLAAAMAHDAFRFVETDLREAELDPLLDGIDVVYHQAAQVGVRLSWAAGFADYATHNVLATQRLLEAAKATGVRRFVYASSSSVYGQAAAYPTVETDLPRPHSPYGATKLAAEHLCNLYAANWGVPTVSLRYFTVYGPRQRPDMAMYRLLEAGIDGTPFPLYGDGSAVRDFTYVGDIVAANMAAGASTCAPGTVVNVAGGGSITMADLLELAGEVVGRPIVVNRLDRQLGDVDRTGGRIDAALQALGWEPHTNLATGVRAQAEWHRSRRPVVAPGR